MKKPKPEMETIRALNANKHDDMEHFIVRLHFGALNLIENEKLAHTAISLEMLETVFSAFEAGFNHGDFASAYPVQAWREDTVEVPRAWVRELVSGWKKYKASEPQTTLGEALGIEGGGQGQQPAKHWLKKAYRDTRLTNKVVVKYLAERADGKIGSWDRACREVAEDEGVGFEVVERAMRDKREDLLNRLSELNAVKDGKSS
ncbi:hypothetical protein PM03_14225 [Thalassobacter stenotrophicus]|uniref:hypothetical protein n=1 Tax=Thalassobacter stenotrophicus TaxID=266809 RepID=UPI00051FC44B|nr:hypothetical protein [Thalassobacter stenotrophicus]KGK78367.1 hypothetical protein PM03_14225 [Thalassobacter stenotrophicus]